MSGREFRVLGAPQRKTWLFLFFFTSIEFGYQQQRQYIAAGGYVVL